jgi:hypothetical protein
VTRIGKSVQNVKFSEVEEEIPERAGISILVRPGTAICDSVECLSQGGSGSKPKRGEKIKGVDKKRERQKKEKK